MRIAVCKLRSPLDGFMHLAKYLLIWAAALAAFAGCRGDGKHPSHAQDAAQAACTSRPAGAAKVILVGLDGADWKIIDDLLARGELPNLARLKAAGSYGRLKSAEPLLSPLIWTTIATGKPPEQHGIVDFLAKDQRSGKLVPITSNIRRVKALWNILGDPDSASVQVGFVGWLASWPAESVSGFIVTDRLGYHMFSHTGAEDLGGDANTHPPELLAEILPLRRRPEEVAWSELSRFIKVPREEFQAEVSQRYTRESPEQNLRLLFSTTETYRRVGLHLLQKHRPEMFGVYFEALDTAGHLFMLYAPQQRADVTKGEFASYGGAVEEVYRYQDEVLGDFLKLADDRTAVIVVSDHGFKTGERRPLRTPAIEGPAAAAWHEIYGVFLAAGYGIDRGEQITGATILDIAPTVLALLGCPVPADMPGRVLTEALDPAFLRHMAVRHIATYEDGAPHNTRLPIASSVDAEIIDRLRALGYVESGETLEAAPLPESTYGLRTLATVYAKKKDYQSAIALYERAIKLEPDNAAAVTDLGSVFLELGLTRRAQEQFERAIALNPRLPEAHNNLAQSLRDQGDMKGAVAAFNRALELEPKHAQIHANLGDVYRMMGDLEMARSELSAAVQLDPDATRVRNNLGAVLLLQNRLDEALVQFEKVIADAPQYALAHHNIGLIQLRQGRPREAEAALRKAATLAPGYGMSKVYLAMAIGTQGRREEALEILRTLPISSKTDPEVTAAAREAEQVISKTAARR